MSISATCGSCAKTYKLADTSAGKKFKCKACGGVVTAPLLEEELETVHEVAAPVGGMGAARPVRAAVSAPVAMPVPQPQVAQPEYATPSAQFRLKTPTQIVTLVILVLTALGSLAYAGILLLGVAAMSARGGTAAEAGMVIGMATALLLFVAMASYVLAAVRIFALNLWALIPAMVCAVLEVVAMGFTLSGVLFSMVGAESMGRRSDPNQVGMMVAAAMTGALILLATATIVSLIRCLRLRARLNQPVVVE